MKYILLIPFVLIALNGYAQTSKTKLTAISKRPITCKLTSPEMQQRKATVIASLKKQILEKKDIANGYSYKFKGNDSVIDELTTFIKTERLCCDFFDFTIKASGDASFTWLLITGPKGAKEFIKEELDL